jgi:hypothetical protein
VIRRALAVAALVVGIASGGCSTLLGADATPVPGAAATLTRSINTPIPTPVRSPSALPSPSPARAAVAASPGPQQAPRGAAVSDSEIAAVQARIEQAVATPGLEGIESLLLDHVSLSTPEGGSVMDNTQAATWLRDHAGSGIRVTQLERGTQELMLQVQTEGWPARDPIQQGHVTFSLRRYDANGRQDDSGGGDWKIDVIDAE